ncbi:hypothetical protein NDU88_001652, partial [Pleurodeles waltl]
SATSASPKWSQSPSTKPDKHLTPSSLPATESNSPHHRTLLDRSQHRPHYHLRCPAHQAPQHFTPEQGQGNEDPMDAGPR